MNNCAVNLTTSEEFTNSTSHSISLINSLQIFVLSINLLFGVPTHSYIIWLIVTGTESGIAMEFFTLNLSICEFANCLNSLMSLFAFFPLFASLSTLTNSLLGLAITGRPLFQCLISVERYLAVVHPVTFLKFKPLRYRLMCCTIVWIISAGSCLLYRFWLPFLMIHGQVCFFSLQFVVFLSIQLFCCVAVLRALKQSGPGERGREREEENIMKRRAFYLILIITVSMFLIYFPFTLSGFYIILTQQFNQEVFFIGFACFILAGFVQPILYLHRVGLLSCFCST